MHPSTESLLRFFDTEHLPEHLAEISAPFGKLARDVVATWGDRPETTVCLRKLLEAKDCAVRAFIEEQRS